MVQWFNQSRHAKTIAIGVSFFCFPLLYVDHHLIKLLQLDFLIWLFFSFLQKSEIFIWFRITEQGKTWGILLFEYADRAKTVIFMNKLSRRQLFWRYKNRDSLEWVDFRIFIVLYQPTCLVINAWNKNKITFVMRDLNFYSVLIKEEILHLQVWFSNLIHQNLSRGMIPKHFLSSNGSKIESKFQAKIPIWTQQMGLKAIKWWKGAFYLLYVFQTRQFFFLVGKRGLWCMLYFVWNCVIWTAKWLWSNTSFIIPQVFV